MSARHPSHIHRYRMSSKFGFASLAVAAMIAGNANAVIRFVDPSSPGPTHNGTTWNFAYTSLVTALAAASSGDEVWIANGTYLPTTTTDRTISFEIPSGVRVFGGFAGAGVNESSLSQRDILANRAVLSGNIGNAGLSTDNSFTVVHFGGVSGTTKLDGVFVTGGFANGGGTDNQGAGLRNSGNPVVRNCVFVGNTSLSNGGAVFCNGGVAVFANCVFSGNTASIGAALDMQNGRVALLGCTFANNNCTVNGGSAVRFLNGDGFANNVDNCIIYNNNAPSGTPQEQQIVATNAPLDMDNCCVQGLDGSLGGVGNIGGLPRFNDPNGADGVFGTVDDDYSLRGGSAGIDAGDNFLVHSDSDDLDDDGITNEPLPFDIAYETRRIEDLVNNTGLGTAPIVDMGAYEFNRVTRTILVNDNATGANNGTTWANAYTDLQSALSELADIKFGGPGEIWVAAGTYKPSIPAGRAATFQMVGQAEIYGGFAGNGSEGSRSQRNPDLHHSILSGDIGTPNSAADNCFHVVKADGGQMFGNAAVLDGVVVTAGNANGGGSANNGGGIDCRNQTTNDPIFRNCLVVGNSSLNAGGGAVCDTSDASFINCVFSGNSASSSGGLALFNAGSPKLINCTIAHNSSVTAGLGGGLTSGGAGQNAQITNCVLVGNTVQFGNGGFQSAQLSLPLGTINYSCVEGLTGSLGGTGNIGSVASFVDADGTDNVFGTPDDDYHLLSCSSVIDTGDLSIVPLDTDDLDDDGHTTSERLPVDHAYSDRFNNDPGIPDSGTGPSPPDMGAYEFQGTSGDTCPADCAPIGGNNTVNIDDLLAVINGWGNCPGSPCQGDTAPPCGNGVVNIDDLLAVINAWGNCP